MTRQGGHQFSARPAPLGAVLWDGHRLDVRGDGVVIGRSPECDVVIDAENVSRRHARIELAGGRFQVVDLGSANGTALNGERFFDEVRPLASGDVISIGASALTFVSGNGTHVGRGDDATGVVRSRAFAVTAGRTSIGRDSRNDLVLDDPNVSRFHCEIVSGAHRLEVRDLGSSNGTRLDGRLITRAALSPGQAIGIGSQRLQFDGQALGASDESGGLSVQARDLTVEVKDRRILQRATVHLPAGQLVGIVGGSGAGKSTLLKAMAGVRQPTHGAVFINGDPISARLAEVGYVPQQDIVHDLLTVTEALTYAARLRLPQDATASDVRSAVARVIEELALNDHAVQRIGSLSGGQKKRVAVAAELVNQPGVLFLDEPTTGLDPHLERRSMELFSALAHDGRAVAVVTHATQSLDLCDRLVVMSPGGVVAFAGPPADTLQHFGVADFEAIYAKLERAPTTSPPTTDDDEFRTQPHTPSGPAAAQQPRRPLIRQWALLSSRYARLFARDHRNVAILALQAPVLALLIASLFKGGVFARPGGRSQEAAQLIFLVATCAAWFGAIDAAREIVKERGVVIRELAVGLRPAAYLASKATVLFALAAAQTAVLLLVVFAIHPLDQSVTVVLQLLGLLILTAWVSVMLGLVISSLVSSQDQATSIIPLVLLPQLLFGGVLVPREEMTAIAGGIADLMFVRWAFAGAGQTIDLNNRIGDDPAFRQVSRFGEDFFATSPAFAAALLAGMAGLFAMVVFRRVSTGLGGAE